MKLRHKLWIPAVIFLGVHMMLGYIGKSHWLSTIFVGAILAGEYILVQSLTGSPGFAAVVSGLGCAICGAADTD